MTFVFVKIASDDLAPAKRFFSSKRISFTIIADMSMFGLICLGFSVAEEDQTRIKNGLRAVCDKRPQFAVP